MTREEKLWTMTGTTLLGVAEKLGIKTSKSTLKQGKEKLIAKILEAENNQTKTEIVPEKIKTKKDFLNAVDNILDGKATVAPAPKKPEPVPMPGTDDPNWGEKAAGETKEQLKPKRGQLIAYNGKEQNICAWAKELGVSANTLYGRIYKLGWSVEDAFTK